MLKGLRSKLALGTVQLGLDYGINNAYGKPSDEEIVATLEFAYQNDVRMLDCADAYGGANLAIGAYHRTSGRHFSIINKFKIDSTPIDAKLSRTLELLDAPLLYCYMYHDFADYTSRSVRDRLLKFRNEGRFLKTGVSIYTIEQLKTAVEDSDIDLIQLPVNLLDLTDEKLRLLSEAKVRGKEIHARSVFFQGLFFKNPDLLTGNMRSLKSYLVDLNALAKSISIDIGTMALNFVAHNEFIDRIVLGVDRVQQLQQNLVQLEKSFDLTALRRIQVGSDDLPLLNPANWRP